MTATVYPWEVEAGDLILGLRTPVATVLQTDGKVWIYAGADGAIIARRPHWGRVQIVRDSPAGRAVGGSGRVELSSGDSPTANSDDCDPHGIARVRGLYMVTP